MKELLEAIAKARHVGNHLRSSTIPLGSAELRTDG